MALVHPIVRKKWIVFLENGVSLPHLLPTLTLQEGDYPDFCFCKFDKFRKKAKNLTCIHALAMKFVDLFVKFLTLRK